MAGLHVTELRAENFKRLRAVRVSLGEGMVTVAGRNGAGKSSVLDAISAAIGGKRMCPDVPVRDGEERAEVSVALGPIVVTRSWDAGGATKLHVTTAPGMKVASPQKMLDALFDPIAFDLSALLAKPPREQRAFLLDALGLSAKDAELESRKRAALDAIQCLTNNAKSAQSQLSKVQSYPSDTPDEPVSLLTDALASHRAAVERHDQASRSLKNKIDARDRIAEDVKRMNAERDALQQRIERLSNEMAGYLASKVDADDAVSRAKAELDAAPEPDAAALDAVREREQRINDAVRSKKLEARLRADVERYELEAEGTRTVVQQIAEERDALIRAAFSGQNRLDYDDNGLTLDGLPLAQASQSERIRVAFALMSRSLATAGKDLRLVLVRDGSLLDAESRRALAEEAVRRDMQVIVEVVGDAGGDIVIEDGAVREPVEI